MGEHKFRFTGPGKKLRTEAHACNPSKGGEGRGGEGRGEEKEKENLYLRNCSSQMTS